MNSQLSFASRALSVLTVFAMQSVSAQDADLHPRGLFNTPQPGLDAPITRTTADAESWKDRLHFSLSSSVRYDDNIYLTSMNEVSDVIFSVSPTLRFNSAEEGSATNTLSITYTPSFRVYADNSERNTVDHSLGIRLGKTMPKTQIGFDVTYAKSTGSDRFVSGTIDRDSLRVGVSLSRILTGKTRLDVGAHYNVDSFGSNALFGDESYGVNAALMYQATGKISVGPYMSYDISNMDQGSRDQDSIGYGLRFQYEVSGKTAITGSLGYSNRSFSGAGASGDYSSSSWGIGVSHALSAKTNIRASIYRKAKASYNFADSGYLSTGASLSAVYQQSVRLSHYATISYENDDYFKASPAGVLLDNDYYSITLGSRYRLENGLTLGANVTYRDNTASESLNDFSNFSFGINASYNFW